MSVDAGGESSKDRSIKKKKGSLGALETTEFSGKE